MAMSMAECTQSIGCSACAPPATGCSGVDGTPSGGYGIYFTESTDNRFIIYADTGAPEGRRDPEGDEDFDAPIFLAEEIYISRVGTTANKVNINFKPPDPEITMKWDVAGEADFVEIDISLRADPTRTKTITINKAGLVSIE